jgi:hypothetical protein
MPKPLPPPYVRMPGRPKTQRTRELGEAPKGTKLSKVGNVGCVIKAHTMQEDVQKIQKQARRKMPTLREMQGKEKEMRSQHLL